MKRLTLHLIFWCIFFAFGIGIYLQKDSSSVQTVQIMAIVWISLYAIILVGDWIQKRKTRNPKLKYKPLIMPEEDKKHIERLHEAGTAEWKPDKFGKKKRKK